jgi:hypothetical protein
VAIALQDLMDSGFGLLGHNEQTDSRCNVASATQLLNAKEPMSLFQLLSSRFDPRFFSFRLRAKLLP